jgi:hypothetical protein
MLKRCQRDKLIAPTREKHVAIDKQSTRLLARKRLLRRPADGLTPT